MAEMRSRDSTDKGMGRIHSLDGLRGVACLAVLFLHIGIMIQPCGPDAPYLLIPGVAAVMVFYVLSGVVLSLAPLKQLHPIHGPHAAEAAGNESSSSYDWFAYYPRRIVRLCVPLFAAILLGAMLGFAAQAVGSSARSAIAVNYAGAPHEILHDIFMQFDLLFNVSDDSLTLHGAPLVRIDSPVWSMSWELWFSIALPLCIFVALLFKRDVLASIALFLCVFVAHFSGYFPLRFGVMFMLGVVIAKHGRWWARKRMPWPLELGAVVLCLALIELPQLGEHGVFLDAVLLTAMNAACAGLVCLALTDGLLRRALSTRPCQWLGKISYSMYLTHAVVIGALGALFSWMGVPAPVQAVIALVASFFAAWAFWRLVERPSIAWSHRVGKLAASMGKR